MSFRVASYSGMWASVTRVFVLVGSVGIFFYQIPLGVEASGCLGRDRVGCLWVWRGERVVGVPGVGFGFLDP